MPGGQKESMKSSFGILLVVVIGVVFTRLALRTNRLLARSRRAERPSIRRIACCAMAVTAMPRRRWASRLGAHDLHSAEVQKKTDAALKNIISNGQKSMPPFQSQLSSAEIGQVVAYVRVLGKKK